MTRLTVTKKQFNGTYMSKMSVTKKRLPIFTFGRQLVVYTLTRLVRLKVNWEEHVHNKIIIMYRIIIEKMGLKNQNIF